MRTCNICDNSWPEGNYCPFCGEADWREGEGDGATQDNLFGDEQAVARATDPQTSWDAARSVTDLTGKQKTVLEVLQYREPLTDEEIYREVRLVMSPSGARTRRSELVRKGLVRWSGETKRGKTGRNMRIWEIAT